MTITRLKVNDVRNLARVDITPSVSLNLIVGANGSGKTSLLEAIHILGRGRSFRRGRLHSTIKHGREQLAVVGDVIGEVGGASVPVGVERGPRGLRMRVDGRDIQSIAELAGRLPLLVLNPDSHRLIEEGPAYRRQFLDWGVFHVEPRFLGEWGRYQRLVRQRNAALIRQATAAEVRAWDAELVGAAEGIDAARRRYLEGLTQWMPRFVRGLIGFEQLEVVYNPGWSVGEPYGAVLERALRRDVDLGYTQYGPHRADLTFKVAGGSVQEFISRGQQKALVTALRLSQVALLRECAGKRCVVLVDDLAAELDARHREGLMRTLAELDVQVFMTAVEAGALCTPWWQPQKVFHVEHGVISEMIY